MTGFHLSLWRASLVAFLLAAWLSGTTVLGADARRSYRIERGDAANTLRQFSVQSGEQTVYPVDRVRGVRTNAIAGEFTAVEALERMLAGTELRVARDNATGALSIRRSTPPLIGRSPAQSVRHPPSDKPGVTDELIQLNPFEVRADPDHSYGALDSTAVTAFRLDLSKIPATTSVFTQTFMEDVAVTSIQELLVNYTGTVGADPNNTGAALIMPGDRDGSGGGLGIRGLAASAPKRDGFIGMRSLFRSPLGYTDNFSVERIEVIEGPQSLLYGAVGGGGVINVVSKRAQFGVSRGSVQTRFDQYGGKRAVVDFNHGTERLALRLAAVGEERRNVRYNLGNDFYGLYAHAAFRLSAGTTLRIYGERNSNWGNVSYTPATGDLNNFLPVGDPRRGQDPRYLALTGQLVDLRGSLWNGPVDYAHLSSFAAWWSSERIEARFGGATLESVLGRGFSAQVNLVYSETNDDRFTSSKNLLPGSGLPGAGTNPFPGTALRVSPGDNLQLDRTRGIRVTLLHEADVHLGRVKGRSQTSLGFEGSHQGPVFGSGGVERFYYQADANWNPIVDPAVTLDYGRVPLTSIHVPISGGIPLRPVFRPGSRRITIGGQNYVLEPRIRQDMSRVTPENPFGLVPNNPTPANPNAFSGAWNRGPETHDRLWHLANFTDWADGKVTTMAGLSVDRFTSLNFGAGTASTYLAPRNYVGYTLGATYRLDRVPGLRAYVTMSTASQSAGSTKDFLGQPLRVPRAQPVFPEFGLKYSTPAHGVVAQLAYNPGTRVRGEARNAGADFFNAVNPAGINGRFNSGDQWINLDREARALELVVTTSPAPHWRTRLSATWLDGEITRTVSYAQLYNDQFHARNGVVTYRDGSPLLVDPLAANGPGTAPLTIAMLNDPAGVFHAAPDPNSGRITNPIVIAALTAIDPTHGAAATGVTGLPISAIQYAFNPPPGGRIAIVSAGDKTTGINEFTFNLQNAYTFSRGPLRGFGVFADLRTYCRNRAYYTSYFPTAGTGSAVQAQRVLYRLPTATVLGLGLSYDFNVLGHAWTTRLNFNNLLNHYRVWVAPNPANGANLNARLSTQPRQIIWSNTVTW